MNDPKYAEVNNKMYKINTDFRVAIKCNEIAEDESIGDYERALAIIYMLFGEEALYDNENHVGLLEKAQKFLCCGKELEETNDKPDMDFVEDYDFIEASFMSDFKIDLENTEMHWWKFMRLMNGLSNSDMGNCCVLNNIRNLRNMDASKIKDEKERRKVVEAQERFALKRNEKKFTKEQQDSIDKFNKLFGLEGM